MRPLLLIALALSGCKPGSWEEFARLAREKTCKRDVVCGVIGASEAPGCTRSVASDIEASNPDLAMGIANSLYAFNGEGGALCLDAIDRAKCEPAQRAQETVLHCHNVVRSLVRPDGACLHDEHCIGGRCESGRCVPYASRNQRCVLTGGTASQSCDPTVHYCAPDSLTCQRHKQENDPCGDAAECAYGMTCSDAICRFWPRAKRGEPCDVLPCDRDEFCAPDGICTELRGEGAACERAHACKPELACTGLDGERPGTCQRWLDRGSPCTPAEVTGCPASMTCTTNLCS
jgi:hypothetical protein